MKRLLKIIFAAVVLIAITLGSILIPRLRNMPSEYATADAIYSLSKFAREHEGRWPSSPADLGGKYPADGDVVIDYSITSSQLIANPSLLREAVRPRSGKFYTYPHYQRDLDRLRAELREAGKRD